MLWFFLALAGAFFDALYYTTVKRYLRDSDKYVLAGGVYLTVFVVLFSFSLFRGIPQFGPLLFPSIFASVLVNLAAIIILYDVLKNSDISVSMPMISFTPLFLILTSFVMLGELPSVAAAAGIILIVSGGYLLQRDETKESERNKGFTKNKTVILMLLVAFLFGVCANYDKLVVLNSDPVFGISVTCLFMGAVFMAIAGYKKKSVLKEFRGNLSKFIVSGILVSLAAVSVTTAFTMQIVPLVVSVKRLSILFMVIFGGFFLGEKSTWKRFWAALLMVAGVILTLF